jgi:peptide-methionine (R)-S-oxide reductase
VGSSNRRLSLGNIFGLLAIEIDVKQWTPLVTAILGLAGCQTSSAEPNPSVPETFAGIEVRKTSPKRADKVVKTDAEWKAQLEPEAYRILRNHGTEAAFCGGYLNVKEKGVFGCGGCGLELFATSAKFESGTGWPSFFQPVKQENVWLKKDTSYGMIRYEVLCARCDGHLGHVFDDGPIDKTGLRYCINSAALKFKAAAKA